MKTERITDIVSQDNSSFTRSRLRMVGMQRFNKEPVLRFVENGTKFNEGKI